MSTYLKEKLIKTIYFENLRCYFLLYIICKISVKRIYILCYKRYHRNIENGGVYGTDANTNRSFGT